MNYQLIIATTSPDVHRYIGIKKLSIIPRDIRENLLDASIRCNIFAILMNTERSAADIISEYIAAQTQIPDGLIIATENPFLHELQDLGDSCFICGYDRDLDGKNIQNYFSRFLSRLMKMFVYYSNYFDQEVYRKILLLPLRNFHSPELSRLREMFRSGVRIRGFEDILDTYIGTTRRRQRPKTKSTSNITYFVDDDARYFEYGHEKHAKPGTKTPPHNILCRLNSGIRFGKAYDHSRHFNVTVEAGHISGTFVNCHSTTVDVSACTHVNLFPNDHV